MVAIIGYYILKKVDRNLIFFTSLFTFLIFLLLFRLNGK